MSAPVDLPAAPGAAPAPSRAVVVKGIAALNAVSALAQLGQWGIAAVLFPLALERRGLPAWQIGIVGSAVWLGMLAGLLVAPGLVLRRGHRFVVLAGLALSAAALLATPALPAAAWALTAALTGLGTGLRWIGLETWLYRVIPNESRGRIVGFHEALMGVAAVVGPGLIALFGVDGSASFIAGTAAMAAAALPLIWANPIRLPALPDTAAANRSLAALRRGLKRYWSLGPAIAGLGGVIDGALLGVFPVYAAAQGVTPAQAAALLSIFGIGAMLLQFPIGWLVDLRGLRQTSVLAALVTVLGAFISLLLPPGGWPLALLMFVLGGSISGFLTLGLIAATQSADAERVTGDVGRVSIAYTSLSAVGPVAAGALASATGARSLMVFIGVMAASLLVVIRAMRG